MGEMSMSGEQTQPGVPSSDERFPGVERHTEKCPRCRGDGHEPGFGHDVAPAAVSPCARCKGSGEVQWIICPVCEGGAAFSPVHCTVCEGAVRIDL
jgi:DnaJ-class molecular chaperone